MKRLLFSVALLLPLIIQAAYSANWQVDYGKSRLGFVATQMGEEFTGQFRKFDARIAFAPDDLTASRFDVVIDVTSIDTQSSDRNSALPNPEWFNFAAFPTARFETLSFTQTGNTSYEAKAKLTIRDVTKEVLFPFTFTTEGETARLTSKMKLLRTDYRIGQGEWNDPETVGHEVTVVVDLFLNKA